MCSVAVVLLFVLGGRRTQIAGCGIDSRHRLSLGHARVGWRLDKDHTDRPRLVRLQLVNLFRAVGNLQLDAGADLLVERRVFPSVLVERRRAKEHGSEVCDAGRVEEAQRLAERRRFVEHEAHSCDAGGVKA